jgi:two-component system response regulator FixJ
MIMFADEAAAQPDLFEADAEPADRFRRRRAPAPDARVVAVIDDDEGARASTAWLLEGEGYRVLAFASGDAFLAARPAERLACALLDLRMPGPSGLDVLAALAERDDAPPVIMVTGHGDVSSAIAAMKLKASDFIQKPYAPSALLQSIERAAAQGDTSHAGAAATREARAAVAGLSERQRQVLAGVARGRANKVIAFELGLSIRTVEAYRAQLFQKLRARSTAEAVRFAVAAGLDRS